MAEDKVTVYTNKLEQAKNALEASTAKEHEASNELDYRKVLRAHDEADVLYYSALLAREIAKKTEE